MCLCGSQKPRVTLCNARCIHRILFLLSKKDLNFEHFWPQDIRVRNCGPVFYGISFFSYLKHKRQPGGPLSIH